VAGSSAPPHENDLVQILRRGFAPFQFTYARLLRTMCSRQSCTSMRGYTVAILFKHRNFWLMTTLERLYEYEEA